MEKFNSEGQDQDHKALIPFPEKIGILAIFGTGLNIYITRSMS